MSHWLQLQLCGLRSSTFPLAQWHLKECVIHLVICKILKQLVSCYTGTLR